MKVRTGVSRFEDIPNVGPATSGDFDRLGIATPEDLPGRNPYGMYDDLCKAMGKRLDPCVIDVFISAVRFMEGEPPQNWWYYTEERKRELARRASA
ncbi:MAG: helix-hairpin-helix domain-containing protein [Gemmatimonadota bacterium]